MIYCREIITEDVKHGIGLRKTIRLISENKADPKTDIPVGMNFITNLAFSLTDRFSGVTIIANDIFNEDVDFDANDVLTIILGVKRYLGNSANKITWWLYTNSNIPRVMDTAHCKHNIFREIVKELEVIVDGEFKPQFEKSNLMFRESYNQNIVYIHHDSTSNVPERYKDFVTLEYCS